MLVAFGKDLGKVGSTAQSWLLFLRATLFQAHQNELDSLQRLLDDHDERLNVIQQESNQLINAQQTAKEDNQWDWVVRQCV